MEKINNSKLKRTITTILMAFMLAMSAGEPTPKNKMREQI